MKFSTTFLPFAAVLVASVASIPVRRDVDPALVPDFGHAAGINPTGTGDCDGAVRGPNGQPIKIPCACPPDRGLFIQKLNQNLAAGHVVNNPGVPISFPTDNSPGSRIARIQAALVTLQNLNGPGVGCPAVSTTLLAQQAAVRKRSPEEFVDYASMAEASWDEEGEEEEEQGVGKRARLAQRAGPDPATVARLAPALGFRSGVNPTGTGDCDGAVKGPDGKAIKIPCACPPAQGTYIAALQANVAAGKAINNPSVRVTYPTGNSNADKSARITAALITLQNLNGPGRGCPAVSTTLLAQQKALA
jgi:hypothetical protein